MQTGFRHRMLLWLLTAVCLLSFALAVPPVAAHAMERPDISREATLVLSYQSEGKKLENVSFQLYRVADMSDSIRFTLAGDFKAYPVQVNNLDSSGWAAAAQTLATYAKADGISPLKEGKTDKEGLLDFGKLQTGLYLIVGETVKQGNKTYTTAPSLLSLPGLLEDDTWNYDLTVNPKSSVHTSHTPGGGGDRPGPSTVQRSVVKVWKDNGFEQQRPSEIKVWLLRDGTRYDSVTLNANNYWRYTWEDLNSSFDWSVLEESVPNGYSVTYAVGNRVLTITNTYTIPRTPDNPPDGEEEILLPDMPEPEAEAPEEKLPQTGLLWWPVPVMAVLGLLLFSAGWYIAMCRQDAKDEK